ncbi:O-antigen polymerase [Mycolicibacterium sp. P1-5]|uniref:O-antigen polymerase n=1 Tax=Mycolicibacterium sp. P1-5 TaxID=2024617 RepID=UPI0011EC5E4D|nr:O-antigen polymerase [Mycolicibacterium sp. P1-5]
MSSDESLSVCVLILMTLAGGAVAVIVARRLHRVLSFRVFAIAFYMTVNVVSGIAHILDTSRIRRGYFDAVASLDPGQLSETSLIEALGLIAICFGVLRGLPRRGTATPPESKSLAPSDRALLIPAIAVLLPASLWSLLKIQAYASTLDSVRIISVSGGMARYAFLSSWFVSAIYFVVIWIASRLPHNRRLLVPLILFVGVVLISASVQWTGSRGSAVFLCLPLILVLAPTLKNVKGPAVAFGAAIGLVSTVVVLRANDLRQSRSAFGSTGLSDWVDWELGRFSMLGFALQSADRYGLLYGETFVNSAAKPLASLSGFLGIELFQSSGRSSVDLAAAQLLNSSKADYIVPGLSAELFLNFGTVGLVLGYFVLGRVCSWTDDRFINSGSLVTQLAWAFVGVEIVRSIAYGGAAIMTILFTGAPLLAVAGVSHLIHRSHLDTAATRADVGRYTGTRGSDRVMSKRYSPSGGRTRCGPASQGAPANTAKEPTAMTAIAKLTSRHGADRPMRSD